MNIAFKPIGKREREALTALGVRGIPPRAPGYSPGSVVTLDGYIVLAFGHGDQVIYQDGSDAVPDLIRAHKRVASALGNLSYEDYQRIKRKGKPPLTVEDILRG